MCREKHRFKRFMLEGNYILNNVEKAINKRSEVGNVGKVLVDFLNRIKN